MGRRGRRGRRGLRGGGWDGEVEGGKAGTVRWKLGTTGIMGTAGTVSKVEDGDGVVMKESWTGNVLSLVTVTLEFTICRFVNKGQCLRPEWIAKQYIMRLLFLSTFFAGIQKMLGAKQIFIGPYLNVKSFYSILFVSALFISNQKYVLWGYHNT